MTITLIGDPPEVVRKVTGFHSLDLAFTNDRGDVGVPIGIGYELFGGSGTGKSTFSYGLAGILAEPPGIVLADLEGFDPKSVVRVLEGVKFDGTLEIATGKTDEAYLDKLVEMLGKDEFSVGILDSIGAISPIAEIEGEIGERNMGQRAFGMAQFTRKLMKLFRDSNDAGKPKTLLAINHWYPKLGSRGYDTPGGEVKKYLLTVRVLLKRAENFKDGSYVLEGTVYKNRYGFSNRKFYAFMLIGKGLHKGLTALYDATLLHKVERKAGIKIGDQSFGYMKNIVEKAQQGDDEFFQPFIDVLKGETSDLTTEEMGVDTETTPELED